MSFELHSAFSALRLDNTPIVLHSFTQVGVQDRIKKIHVYSVKKIVLITEDNRQIEPTFCNLPVLSREQLEKYLEATSLSITQFADGGFTISSHLRLVGGGKNTALHKAVKKNNNLTAVLKAINEDVVRKQKYTIDALNKENLTPLALACQKVPANMDLIELLLRSGAKANNSPFNEACKAGNIAAVHRLFPLIDDINQVDADGNTPLALACKNKRADIIDYLLARPADPDKKNTAGLTPLHIAFQAGADYAILAKLIPLTKDLDTYEKDTTMLYDACAKGNEEIAKLLLEHGADPNKPTRGATPQFTPLHGVCHPNGCRKVTIINLLVSANAEVNALSNSNQNALHLACNAANLQKTVDRDVIRRLVELGVDQNHRSDSGSTPLDVARGYKLEKTIAYLSNHPRPKLQSVVAPLITPAMIAVAQGISEQVATRAMRSLNADSVKLPLDVSTSIKNAIKEQLLASSHLLSGIGGDEVSVVAERLDLGEKIKHEIKLCLSDESAYNPAMGALDLSEIKTATQQGLAMWSSARNQALTTQRQAEQMLSYAARTPTAAASLAATAGGASAADLAGMANDLTGAVSNIVGLFNS